MDIDVWNNIRVATWALAALGAVLALVANYVQLQLQKADSKAATEALERYKLDAGTQIATANQRAAEANERAAALQRIALRILPVPTQNSLVELLKATRSFSVQIGTTTPLSHAFDIDSLVAQIAGVLSLAGWKPVTTVWGKDDRPNGIAISVREGDAEAAAASEIIAKELNAAGIVSHRVPEPFAGPKPPKPQPPELDQNSADPATVTDNARRQRNYAEAAGQWSRMPDIQIMVGTKP